jgi:hypothetical protein
MTAPRLMNCCHRGDGWCLDCVANMNNEIEQLRESIRWHKEVLVEAEELMLRKNLTDAEREAIRGAAAAVSAYYGDRRHGEILLGLLERLG